MNYKTKQFKQWKISYINEMELNEMMFELYNKKFYQFSTKKKSPTIFEVGALIGETVLFFKDLYPHAYITAFEPSPRSFRLLKRNVLQNNLTHVKVINSAVSSSEGKMKFYTSKSENNPWGRGDSLKENKFNNSQSSKVVTVRTVRLSRFINKQVDLLKLDIEGAETEVITEIQAKLRFIQNVILEFHGSKFNPENKLSKIIATLESHGFNTSIYLVSWKIPKFLTNVIVLLLTLFRKDEYWLRIYAQRP